MIYSHFKVKNYPNIFPRICPKTFNDRSVTQPWHAFTGMGIVDTKASETLDYRKNPQINAIYIYLQKLMDYTQKRYYYEH